MLFGIGDDLSDNGITTGDSFTIDYGSGPDLTPAEVTQAQSIITDTPSSSPSSSILGSGTSSFFSSVGTLFGGVAKALTGSGPAIGTQQYLAAQAAANAQRNNMLMLVGGLGAAAALGYLFLHRRKGSA